MCVSVSQFLVLTTIGAEGVKIVEGVARVEFGVLCGGRGRDGGRGGGHGVGRFCWTKPINDTKGN